MDLTKIGACKICGENLTTDHVCDKFARMRWLDEQVKKWDSIDCIECEKKDASIKELVEALKKITHEIDYYDEARQWVSAATLEHCLDLIAKYKDPS